MIIEYHRPQKIEEALELLARKEPLTLPLGGGTFLTQHAPQDCAVVDLQALHLDYVKTEGNQLVIGSTLSLQLLLEYPDTPQALRAAIWQETNINLRQIATITGTLACSEACSPIAVTLMALDARLVSIPGDEEKSLGEWLLQRGEAGRGRLVSKVIFPQNVWLGYEGVGRTPADKPAICAAVAKWPSGRTRIVIGAGGAMPSLIADGPDSSGVVDTLQISESQNGKSWAGREYKENAAKILLQRLLNASQA